MQSHERTLTSIDRYEFQGVQYNHAIIVTATILKYLPINKQAPIRVNPWKFVGKPPPIQSFPPFFITSHHSLIAWPWIINASLKQNWSYCGGTIFEPAIQRRTGTSALHVITLCFS